MFGGCYGLHHLYLGRDLDAFIWWSTLGGFFGLCWIVDLFRIPNYVRDANQDPEFMQKFENKVRTQKKPAFSSWRFIFSVMVGYLWSQLIFIAIPQENFAGIDWSYLHWLIPFGAAFGILNYISY